MFEIKFKITENVEELKNASLRRFNRELYNICGLFQLKIGRHGNIGFFTDEAMPEDFIGDELLTAWFSGLLDVAILLRNKKKCRVIMQLIDLYGQGLLFTKGDDEDYVTISSISLTTPVDAIPIVSYENEDCKYETEWVESNILYMDVEKEIVEKAWEFVEEIRKINPILLESRTVKLILEKLER